MVVNWCCKLTQKQWELSIFITWKLKQFWEISINHRHKTIKVNSRPHPLTMTLSGSQVVQHAVAQFPGRRAWATFNPWIGVPAWTLMAAISFSSVRVLYCGWSEYDCAWKINPPVFLLVDPPRNWIWPAGVLRSRQWAAVSDHLVPIADTPQINPPGSLKNYNYLKFSHKKSTKPTSSQVKQHKHMWKLWNISWIATNNEWRWSNVLTFTPWCTTAFSLVCWFQTEGTDGSQSKKYKNENFHGWFEV